MINGKVKYGQNIYSACIENYGTIISIKNFIIDNNLSFDSNINQGENIIIDETGGNDIVKSYLKTNKLIPINPNKEITPPVNNWILATGFWDDLGIWIDTEIWID